MGTYFQFASIKFRNNMAYRFDYLLGILNTFLSFIVYWSIYKSLYGDATEVDGVTFSMVTTNFIISLGLSSAFSKNEMFLQDKIKQGTIANELLKPVNFKLRMLFEDLGEGAFRVIFNFLPTVLIAAFFAKFQAPSSVLNIFLCLVSVWGLVTIKNVIINILAGAYIPMWFMPYWLKEFIQFTPFDSIYFTPVQIYLGELQGHEIIIHFLKQILWIAILYVIGELYWRKGIKRIVVQGG